MRHSSSEDRDKVVVPAADVTAAHHSDSTLLRPILTMRRLVPECIRHSHARSGFEHSIILIQIFKAATKIHFLALDWSGSPFLG